MKTIYLVVSFLSFALLSDASASPVMKWARTRDKEGSTNVRAVPNLKGRVLTRIVVAEMFKSEPKPKGEWHRVITKAKIYGYVHKDRIQFIEEAGPKADTATTLAGVFKRQRDLLNRFSAESVHSPELTQELDTHTDVHFEPALERFSTYVCSNKDSLLVDDLFETILADHVGTTETPANSLARALMCQSDLILHSIRKLPKSRKDAMIDKILLGLQNYFDISEDQDRDQLPKDYKRLKVRLDELREKKSD